MTLLAPLITGYLRDYMPRQRGYSPHSCETYAYGFRLLFTFAAKRTVTRPSQLHLEQLDAKLILGFLTHIEGERGNGAGTRNLRLAAIKSFMRYVEYRVPSALEQIGQIQAIPTKRHDQRLIRHLTMEEVRAILNAPDITTRLGIRDQAMLHLCFAAGLRVSELIGASLENLSLRRPASILIRGKGRKERSLPLWKETTADLRAWLAVRGNTRASDLFVNAEGAPMTRAGFEYVLDKHTRRGQKLSFLGGPLGVTPPVAAQLRRDHVAGDGRYPKGRALARACRYPDHRSLPADGCNGKAGGGRGGASAGVAARPV